MLQYLFRSQNLLVKLKCVTIRHNDFCYIDQLINSIRKTEFSRQIKAR